MTNSEILSSAVPFCVYSPACPQFHPCRVPEPQGCQVTAIPCSRVLRQVHVCLPLNFLGTPSDSFTHSLTGMSGQFNTSVQQEIDGQSTAPIGGTAAPTSGTSSPTAAPKTTASSSGTSKAASPTSTTKSNGADKHGVTSLAGLVGVAAALFGAALL